MGWRLGGRLAAVAAVTAVTAVTACHAPNSPRPALPAAALPSSLPAPPTAPSQKRPDQHARPATQHPAIAAMPASDAQIAVPLLFAATRDGHTSYLLGTLHLGVDATRQLPPWVWHYFTTAATFAMEADPNDARLQQAMFRNDGSTLRDELGNVTWRRLQIALGESAAQALNDLTVPMATMLIALTGLPQTPPMEAAFADAAAAQHKPVVFLEAMAVQLRISNKWLDTAALTSMLDDLQLVALRNRELLSAYLKGELSGLRQVVHDGRSDFLRTGRPGNQYDAMMAELLDQRNHMWVPVVEKLHRPEPTFIVVGALHLPGPAGLIALLRQRGFVVAQLKQP